jgi:colanic acid biosynthesis protein WcaH
LTFQSKDTDFSRALKLITERMPDPTKGLDDDLFYLVSRLTPLVNADLLIKNTDQQILLTWRSDQFYGPGWHVPGGILRFKETFETRIQKIARNELGTSVIAAPSPCATHTTINTSRDIRGHFISFLFPCQLQEPLDNAMKFTPQNPKNNQWMWHSYLPENFLKEQREIYSDIFRY